MFEDLKGVGILMIMVSFLCVCVHSLDNPESRFVHLANVIPYEK